MWLKSYTRLYHTKWQYALIFLNNLINYIFLSLLFIFCDTMNWRMQIIYSFLIYVQLRAFTLYYVRFFLWILNLRNIYLYYFVWCLRLPYALAAASPKKNIRSTSRVSLQLITWVYLKNTLNQPVPTKRMQMPFMRPTQSFLPTIS